MLRDDAAVTCAVFSRHGLGGHDELLIRGTK
jgi:hypothetical protein